MKWHLIVGLLVASLLHEALASRQFFKFGKDKSRSRSPSPRNDPANRRPTSNAVVPYNPPNSQFSSRTPTPIGPTPFRPLPLPTPSYLPRNRSPLPPPRGDRFERLGNVRPTPAAGTSKSKTSGIGTLKKNKPETGTLRPPIRLVPSISSGSRRSNPLPSLQQLSHQMPSTSSHPQPSTSSHPQPSTSSHPQPSTSSHPQPSTSTHPQPISNHPQHSSSTNPQPSASSNSGPLPSNPSNFQPPVPGSLIQASLDPAAQKQLARQQAKLAKNQIKTGRIVKNKAKVNQAAQVTTIEGTKYPNRAAVKCSDPNAPPQSCFDFYVLSVSWGPVARVVRSGASEHITEKIQSKWTLHGLWPSLQNFNRVPASCNLDIPWNTAQLRSIYTSMKRKWFTTYTRYRVDEQFWQHEWDKHGRCAARSHFINRDILAYFKLGLRLFDQANVQEKLRRAGITAGTTLSIREMRNAVSNALGTRVNLLHINYPVNMLLMLIFKFKASRFGFLVQNFPFRSFFRPNNSDL
ncbi:Similar to Extracellular ribonuclease LE (Solanum lycopersicum) [Cotesia congregata]|uniref:Similar to Extracellular ribonuclease LE (Solanum lycopersicum) n=1 Tax=Cotesia congregata TaxID=51543 RepID=A0A8J2GZW2_COTCN|nr:Similar to Extracellular ribonuclease LE (Solanum lycopersicum) [Cotesia congregata]